MTTGSIIRAFILLFVSVLPAQALTETQKSIAEAMGLLATAEKWCTEYRVDMVKMAMIAVAGEINPQDPELQPLINESATTVQKTMGVLGEHVWCGQAYKLFGPAGMLASKGGNAGVLMMKR